MPWLPVSFPQPAATYGAVGLLIVPESLSLLYGGRTIQTRRTIPRSIRRLPRVRPQLL